MKIDQSQLDRAMVELGFTPDQSTLLWNKLDSTRGVEGHFEPAHVGYFFGRPASNQRDGMVYYP
jgi:hypothetical protein